MSTTQVKVSCNICGAQSNYKMKLKNWDIYECPNCLTQFINPIPDNETLNALYEDYYFNVEQSRRLLNPKYGILSFPRQWHIINGLVHRKISKILDYGCGGGHFLDRVSGEWGRYGVEISQEARDIANHKPICVMPDIEYGKFPEGFFDVITMFAVIEHLPNPKEIVIQLSNFLKPNGIFVIMTGDVSSLKAKVHKRKWHLYAPPGHIFYFNSNSLDNLMKGLGYVKIKHIYTDGGETRIPVTLFNYALRVGIEIFQRMPYLRSLPLFDCYYGYYRKVK